MREQTLFCRTFPRDCHRAALFCFAETSKETFSAGDWPWPTTFATRRRPKERLRGLPPPPRSRLESYFFHVVLLLVIFNHALIVGALPSLFLLLSSTPFLLKETNSRIGYVDRHCNSDLLVLTSQFHFCPAPPPVFFSSISFFSLHQNTAYRRHGRFIFVRTSLSAQRRHHVHTYSFQPAWLRHTYSKCQAQYHALGKGDTSRVRNAGCGCM